MKRFPTTPEAIRKREIEMRRLMAQVEVRRAYAVIMRVPGSAHDWELMPDLFWTREEAEAAAAFLGYLGSDISVTRVNQ